MTEIHHADRAGYAASTFDRLNRNHRNEVNRARQAAEALFAPKPRAAEPAIQVLIASTTQAARKPRILSAVPAQPTRGETVKASGKVMSRTMAKQMGLGRCRASGEIAAPSETPAETTPPSNLKRRGRPKNAES